jgi:mannitol-1-/sugar-/sorbitol-6-phosphatase
LYRFLVFSVSSQADFRGAYSALSPLPFLPIPLHFDLLGAETGATNCQRQCKLESMTVIRCSAMLFDLDGVLIDSTPAVERVWRGWAIEHGFDPETVVRMAHGRPSRTTIRELLPDADIEREDREVEGREMEDLGGVVLLPGARELLNALPPERWTIATSCTRPLAEVRLKAAGLPIPKTLITSSDVTMGKPDPEPYLKAAANLGFSASDCIVVEDAPAGVRAGKAAGARVIAFLTTMVRRELEEAGADWIARNCADIAASRDDRDQDIRLSLSL